jgi:hypothetical protein
LEDTIIQDRNRKLKPWKGGRKKYANHRSYCTYCDKVKFGSELPGNQGRKKLGRVKG